MKSIIIMSSLVLLSACATTSAQDQPTVGSASGMSSSKDQPCHLPAARSSTHRHAYDENAYLRRISYNR